MGVLKTREYTPEVARIAVERGAAWLDKKCPDWLSHLDMKVLDLSSSYYCMLGQTGECITGEAFSYYEDVLGHIDRTNVWAQKYGFNVPFSGNSSEDEVRYEVLTLTWREYIRERGQVKA